MIAVTFPSAAGQTGSNYNVPEPGDVMTQSLTDYLVALASKALALPSTADLDLGASFGIKSIYFKTRTANPAASGVVRLANADSIAFRNVGNSADLALTIDAGNNLQFAGANLTGNPMMSASTTAGQSIPNSTFTIVVFGTVDRDSDSAYNAGTGRYTIPTGKGGDYIITSTIAYSAAITAAGAIIALFKNGSQGKTFQWVGPPATASISFEAVVNLAAGDVIDIRTYQGTAGAVTLYTGAGYNFFTLKRIPT